MKGMGKNSFERGKYFVALAYKDKGTDTPKKG